MSELFARPSPSRVERGFDYPVDVVCLSSENADVNVREYEAARISGA